MSLQLLQRIEKIAIGMMIITMPITVLPARFSLPLLGNHLYSIFLYIGLIALGLEAYQYKNVEIPFARYILIVIIWFSLCTIIGSIVLPTDVMVHAIAQSHKIFIKLSEIYPKIFDTGNATIAFGICLSMWVMLKNFLLPFIGIFILVYHLYKDNWQRGLKNISTTAYILAILLGIYSIPEIIWLWTGDVTSENILKFINVFLYDPASANGWWPYLLWKDQLRSFCTEPSNFGMIASFIVPLLWYRIQVLNKKVDRFLLLYLLLMIFMTKSRVALVSYSAEMIFLIAITIYVRYSSWKSITISVLVSTFIVFGIYNGISSYILQVNQKQNQYQYAVQYAKENIGTAVEAKTNNRSNAARYGVTAAALNVGKDYPLFGIGFGYQGYYLQSRFPAFAVDNPEIINWTKYMHQLGFLKTSYPVLNQYVFVFAWFGFIGIILFLLPVGYILGNMHKKRIYSSDFAAIIGVVILLDQLINMMAWEFMYSYPIILSLLICAVKTRRRII